MQDSGPMAATTAFLSGLRVLDLSIWRPGPYATSLLVPLGADVLKVEPPGGDPMRHYPGLFDAVNAGKRSVELDLKDEGGRAGRSSWRPRRTCSSRASAPGYSGSSGSTKRPCGR